MWAVAPSVPLGPLLPWSVMRRGFLIRSVQRLLRPDEALVDVVFMWARHRWMMPFTGVAFVGLVVVAAASGIAEWSVRLGLGVAGGAGVGLSPAANPGGGPPPGGLVLWGGGGGGFLLYI